MGLDFFFLVVALDFEIGQNQDHFFCYVSEHYHLEQGFSSHDATESAAVIQQHLGELGGVRVSK